MYVVLFMFCYLFVCVSVCVASIVVLTLYFLLLQRIHHDAKFYGRHLYDFLLYFATYELRISSSLSVLFSHKKKIWPVDIIKTLKVPKATTLTVHSKLVVTFVTHIIWRAILLKQAKK